MKKLWAILLALMLPVATCLAENQLVDYSIAFSMRAENDKTMQALADMLNICTLEGTFASYEQDDFDLQTRLLLQNNESTRTTLRLYGNSDKWGIIASFLGDQELRVENITLMEFCHKINDHMGIPLEDVAILYPVCTKLAFSPMAEAWTQTMCRSATSRTISLAELRALSTNLAALSQSNRAFVYWLKSTAHDSSLEADFLEALSTMDEWLKDHVGGNGIQVAVKKDSEQWSAKGTTFFEKTVVNGVETAKLTLDDLPCAFQLQIEWTMTRTEGCNDHGAFSFDFRQESNVILSGSGSMEGWPLDGDLSSGGNVMLDIRGIMSGIWDGTTFAIKADPMEEQTQKLELTLKKKSTEMTASCLLHYRTPQEQAFTYTLPTLCLNTLNDDRLSSFVAAAAPAAIRNLVPLVMYAPASFCGILMDFAESAGVYDALMPSDPIEEEY